MVITDSLATAANSVANSFGYNSVLQVTVTGAATIDAGQSATLTANPSGGTLAYGSYGYQWYANAGCSVLMTGKTGSTMTDSPLTTNTYCVKVTDSATTATSNTATNTITLCHLPSDS